MEPGAQCVAAPVVKSQMSVLPSLMVSLGLVGLLAACIVRVIHVEERLDALDRRVQRIDSPPTPLEISPIMQPTAAVVPSRVGEAGSVDGDEAWEEEEDMDTPTLVVENNVPQSNADADDDDDEDEAPPGE